jgi:hypothetical protein
MQTLISLIRLAFGLMLLPFTGIVAIWWVFMLPFRLLGAVFGGGGVPVRRPRSSGPRHYMVQSNGRTRSYFVTRGS